MTRKEQEDLHARVLDRVRRMAPKEGFRALIESGIFTQQGELAPEYGGPKRHSRKDKLMKKKTGSFERIHRAKIRDRKAQIRARAKGHSHEGFSIAKQVDPELLKRPLNLSRAKVPERSSKDMIHYHCKIRKDHYWGVGCTNKPTLETALKAGFTRREAAQRLRRFHDAVLLLAGAGWEQVQITLTPEEAREIAAELLGRAEEVEKRTSIGKAKQGRRSIKGPRSKAPPAK